MPLRTYTETPDVLLGRTFEPFYILYVIIGSALSHVTKLHGMSENKIRG
jgi:hypothetical protein